MGSSREVAEKVYEDLFPGNLFIPATPEFAGLAEIWAKVFRRDAVERIAKILEASYDHKTV